MRYTVFAVYSFCFFVQNYTLFIDRIDHDKLKAITDVDMSLKDLGNLGKYWFCFFTIWTYVSTMKYDKKPGNGELFCELIISAGKARIN